MFVVEVDAQEWWHWPVVYIDVVGCASVEGPVISSEVARLLMGLGRAASSLATADLWPILF